MRDLKVPQTALVAVCIYNLLINIIVNVDHGALPAALIDISKSVKLNDSQMGTLGSLVYFGLFFGSLMASVVYYRLKYKTIIISTLILNGFAQWIFTTQDNYVFMCLARFIAGFSQIFITIYIPLYMDAFMTQKHKSFLLSVALLCSTLGVVIGYGFTSFVIIRKGVWPTIYDAYWW